MYDGCTAACGWWRGAVGLQSDSVIIKYLGGQEEGPPSPIGSVIWRDAVELFLYFPFNSLLFVTELSYSVFLRKRPPSLTSLCRSHSFACFRSAVPFVHRHAQFPVKCVPLDWQIVHQTQPGRETLKRLMLVWRSLVGGYCSIDIGGSGLKQRYTFKW